MQGIIRRYLYINKTTLGTAKKMRNGKWRDYWVYNYYEVQFEKEREIDLERFNMVNAHVKLLSGEFPEVKIGEFNYRNIHERYVGIQEAIESVNGYEYVCIHNIDGTMFLSRKIYGPPNDYLMRDLSAVE